MVQSITEYVSYFEAGEDMTDEEYGIYMRAIHKFAYLDIEPDYPSLPPLVKAALRTVIASIRKNKEDRINGSKGGAKIGNQNARKKQPTEEVENNPPCFFETTNEKENVKDKENVNDNANLNSAEPSEKPTLAEREPKNDIEQVEKAYLLNYGSLYKLGILKSEKPIINWGQSRKLTRSAIDSYGLENILLAIERSKDSEFCIKKGYSLSTILSAGVLAGLINGGEQYVKKKSALADFESPPDIMDDVIF